MWIEREIASTVARAASRFPALLLTGPRQVGKTSLLRRQFAGATYVTLDLPALARQAEETPERFLGSLAEPVILDEVQYAPSLFRHLKARIDARRQPGRYLLTGSQTFALMSNVSETLAGRCAIIEMQSLGIRELIAAEIEVDEGDFLVRGGFPELWADRHDELWYGSYVATYLERDVRNIKNVGDLRDFDRFLRAVALRTGQLLSYSDLARDVGVAPNTAKAWLSVLVSSGQAFLLEPYHRSLGKRLVKSPKLYLLDTGLACNLLGITGEAMFMRSPLAGALWETYVLGQLVRHFRNRGARPPLWFWRTSTGDEVDILIEHGARFVAVEAKLSELPGAESTRGLASLARLYGARAVERGYIACRTKDRFVLRGQPAAEAVSVPELLAELETLQAGRGPR